MLPNNNPPVTNRLLSIKNIGKCVILVILIAVLGLLVKYLFSEAYLRSRVPESLTSETKKPQIVSPMQSDYLSFYYYKEIDELSRKLAKQDRSPTPKQLEMFSKIRFEELLNIFRVSTTIQYAKQYSKTREEQQANYNPPKDLDINEPRNFTQYFNEAVNQYMCSSCYAFPITATIEFLYKYYYNITVKLSEQQLIDCVNQQEDINGCEDGNITKGFEYARDIGLVQSKNYPYQSMQGKSFPCRNNVIENKEIKKYKISGFQMHPEGSCKAIREQLVKNKTVAAMINAITFDKYKMYETFSDCKRINLNHAITIVGQTEKSEWIVRNSWGKNWGENGYLKLGRGNTCGVCSHSITPILIMKNDTVVPNENIHEGQ